MLHEALQMIHTNNVNQARKAKLSESNSTHKMQSSTQNIQKSRSTPHFNTLSFGSSVAIHKLRESKWFPHNECNIFLSVVESGFILERKLSDESAERAWGIALWKPGQEKSKNINHIRIYCLVAEKDVRKIAELELSKFWLPESKIRINNQQDKDKRPNSDEDIRKQIEYATRNKNMKWHNSQHFPNWCRYDKPMIGRIQQISDRVKWNNIGVSVGMLLMKSRNRRPTASS